MSQKPNNSPPAKGEYAEGGRGFVLSQRVGERLQIQQHAAVLPLALQAELLNS